MSAPVLSYTGHTNNVTALGYQKEGKWLFSASEDKTVKIWDVRAAGCQREMENASPVNTAALHPNQVELVYGDQVLNQSSLFVFVLTLFRSGRNS